MRKSTPARKPMTPMANIWKGVHGPWLRKMLEQSILTAPTRKPDSPPKATAVMTTMAVTGLNWGSMKNAALPATAMALSVAMVTSSLAMGRRLSKTRKKGSIVIARISRLIR